MTRSDDASDAAISLTRAQVREVDRRAIEQYHVPGIVLMENAARAVVREALNMLRGQDDGRAFVDIGSAGDVVIVCGGGNNGGDGLAVARHLHNAGARVRIVMGTDPHTYHGDAAINWAIVQAMALEVADEADVPARLGDAALVIDALFGTGLSSPPRDGRLIEMMNRAPALVLAIDLPSGLDCDTGQPLGDACVRAARTVTFVAQKAGFADPASRAFTGQIVVGDIGCPRQIVADVLREMPRSTQP